VIHTQLRRVFPIICWIPIEYMRKGLQIFLTAIPIETWCLISWSSFWGREQEQIGKAPCGQVFLTASMWRVFDRLYSQVWEVALWVKRVAVYLNHYLNIKL
jgi:hypothetical protein